MKLVLALVAGAVLALTGCSGGSDQPAARSRTVSLEEFCSSLDRLDSASSVADAQKAIAGLGTPKEMPTDAVAGYDALRKVVAGIDPRTKPQDFGQALTKAMSTSDVQDVQTFATWADKSCHLGASSAP